MKERRIVTSSITAAIGILTATVVVLDRSIAPAYQKGLKEGMRLGYTEGRTEGYGIGSQETRQRIASDLAELGMPNPIRMISDHPSIPPVPVPYFLDNEFKPRGEKK